MYYNPSILEGDMGECVSHLKMTTADSIQLYWPEQCVNMCFAAISTQAVESWRMSLKVTTYRWNKSYQPVWNNKWWACMSGDMEKCHPSGAMLCPRATLLPQNDNFFQCRPTCWSPFIYCYQLGFRMQPKAICWWRCMCGGCVTRFVATLHPFWWTNMF